MIGQRRHVSPKSDDVRVMNPETGTPVPPEGVTVTWSVFWQRRHRDNEIDHSDPPKFDDDGNPIVEPPPTEAPTSDAPEAPEPGDDATPVPTADDAPGEAPTNDAPKRARKADR